MEKKTYTQQIKNNLAQAKENVNWIGIIVIFLSNLIFKVLSFDGGVGLTILPNTFLGWSLWILDIAIQLAFSMTVLYLFRLQGLKDGHLEIKDTYIKYLRTQIASKETKSMSKKEYLVCEGKRDAMTKLPLLLALHLFVAHAIISLSLNGVISILVNTMTSIVFGLMAMQSAKEFVIERLVLWYDERIKENEQKAMNTVERQEPKKIDGQIEEAQINEPEKSNETYKTEQPSTQITTNTTVTANQAQDNNTIDNSNSDSGSTGSVVDI